MVRSLLQIGPIWFEVCDVDFLSYESGTLRYSLACACVVTHLCFPFTVTSDSC